MNLNDPLRSLASDSTATLEGADARCVAANFRWEQAVSSGRADEYNAYVDNVTNHKAWQAEHTGYVRSFIHVAKDHPRVAESFMGLNNQAHLSEKLDNTYLLRLESLSGMVGSRLHGALGETFWQRFFNSQKDLRKAKLSYYDNQLLSEFVAQWNAKRIQARPMFSAFLNDFGGNLEAFIKTDWPHTLRDSLGLTHISCTPGNPLPVALMSYTLNEVRAARTMAAKKGAVASFARPTVLDGEMNAAFIPAPLQRGGESYGYTLNLSNGAIPTAFTPELLTFPIDYLPRHIKALGFITQPHDLQTDTAILEARNRHIQGLQAMPVLSSFGEVLA